MDSPKNPRVDSPVDELCAAIEAGTSPPAEIFTPDVTLDATVPNWRFRIGGVERVRDQLASWYSSPGRFDEMERTPAPDGALVVFTLTWEEKGAPYAAHQAYIVKTRGALISSLTLFCGGRWSAALLAEIGASAHAG